MVLKDPTTEDEDAEQAGPEPPGGEGSPAPSDPKLHDEAPPSPIPARERGAQGLLPRSRLRLALVLGGPIACSLLVWAAVRLLPAPPAPPPVVVVVADASPPADADAEVESGPRECEAQYDALLASAAASMKKRKYEDCVVDLSAALRCRPDDARVLSDRGYAQHLLKDEEYANKDLSEASTNTKDRKLLGQIWYRRGLVDLAVWGEEHARPAFAASYSFVPTADAKARAGGPNICDIEVLRASGNTEPVKTSYPDGDPSGVVTDQVQRGAKDLVTLFPFLSGWNQDLLPRGTKVTEAVLWEALGESHPPSLPRIVALTNGAVSSKVLLFRRAGQVWGILLGELYWSWQSLTGDADFAIVSSPPGLLHAHGYLSHSSEVAPEHDTPPGGHLWRPGPVTEVDAIMDLAKGRGMVIRRALPGRYEERGSVPSAKVTLTPTTARVVGLGCNETVLIDDSTPDELDAGGAAGRDSGVDSGNAARPGDSGHDGGARPSTDAAGL